MTPAAIPIIMAPLTFTNPAAGVMATNPATAPEARPSTVGFLEWSHSVNIHARAATAVAVFVLIKAAPARPFAANAEPALKPNHPNQRSPAPVTTRVRLLGMRDFSRLLPRTNAPTRAAIPALIWTTVPPAKSRAPSFARNPLPHTQCAMGRYTRVIQSMEKSTHAENFILSIYAPLASATVMAAKVSW